MRVTKEVAAQNREKILETATRLFKTRGYDNVSIADLTKAAGFTHGGFYNHFESKADLATETVRYAFDRTLSRIEATSDLELDDFVPMAQRLAYYLSPEHRDQEDGGCPTSSLPGDVARQSADAQRAFADGLERYIDLIGVDTGLEGPSRREAAIKTLATMVGALTLSRAVVRGAPGLSEELLRVAREHSANTEDRT